jgi:DNA topoisomerase VI subunit A
MEQCHRNAKSRRNIYYQNIDLYKSQNAVDELVDNIAYTLRVGREDLNIVRQLADTYGTGF